MNIPEQRFTEDFFEILDETFVTSRGIFLDKNTSLFETLATVSAEEASQPVGGKCATLAAQVAHVTFYLDVLEKYLLHQDTDNVDWGEVWRTVGAVTPDEWSVLNQTLQQTYERVVTLLRGLDWSAERSVGGALAIVVHSAYHLGEIRQALCTLK